ncbi:hypothetical protein PG988_007873 [Apiospora saccharicola]
MDGHSRCSSDRSLLDSHSAAGYAESDIQGLLSEKQVRRSYSWSFKLRRVIRDPWVSIPCIVALVSLCMAAYFNYQLRAQLRKTVELPYTGQHHGEMKPGPANHLIRYERRPFVLGFGDNLTEYEADPSPELDAKWDDLYAMGIVAISQKQASHMAEKTQPLPHDPEHRYVVGLNVFHDLHCLVSHLWG